MDFLHRSANNQPQSRGNGGGQGPSAGVSANVERVKKMIDVDQPRWIRVIFVALLFSVTILVLAIAVLFYSGRPNEGQLVDNNKEQAVFLTNGQVYFGKLKEVNSEFFNLQSIYYLNSQSQTDSSSSSSQATSFSLVKLGCELHGPADQMVINRQQVSFWENLKTDGKVAKAIDQWKTENPNGQKCTDTTNSTQQSTSATSADTTKQ